MDDFRLRVFITAAKTLNFTKCAEQLYISQPAVSKHIGELESRYKVQLFERSGSRLALTEAGRVMLEHAERIADGYRRLQYEMDLFTDRLGGELKVGASTTIAQYVLPQVLARFTARATVRSTPNSRLAIWQATRLSSSEPVTATKASQLATSAVRRVSTLMESPQMTGMSSISASIRHWLSTGSMMTISWWLVSRL